MGLIDSTEGLAEAPAIVVWGAGWHVGVIGIVASRIMERYWRPVCVIGVHDGVGKGSLRSVPGINVFEALNKCSDHLVHFGGHKQAAGLTIVEQEVEGFVSDFQAAVSEVAADDAFERVVYVDAEWPIHRCDMDLCEELGKLKPHGVGNPEPRFLARGTQVKWSREARNNTLLMGLDEKDVTIKAVGFGMGDRMPEVGERLDVIYTPEINEWKDSRSVNLRIRDFAKSRG